MIKPIVILTILLIVPAVAMAQITNPTPFPNAQGLDDSLGDASDALSDLNTSDASLDALDTAMPSSAYIGLAFAYAKWILSSPREIFGIFTDLVLHIAVFTTIGMVWFGIYSAINLGVVIIRFVAWLIKFIPFIG
jgi:hypothetical protein